MQTIKHRSDYITIVIFAVINLAIHLIADTNAGFNGDELLHIEAGRHLAAGYMDFPPVIAFLAWFQNLFSSQSIFINHITVYLASTLIIIICGLITIELGGKWMSVMITLACIVFSPGFGASHSLFLPDIFDQLAWIASLYFVLRFCKTLDSQYLLLAAISAAMGFLTKYTMAFMVMGLAISILVFDRDLMRRKIFWLSVMVFLIIITPNVVWQVKNGIPFLAHVSELYKTQLNRLSMIDELKNVVLYLNPLAAPFWIAGLFVVPFIKRNREYRLYTFTLLFSFLLLILARAKSYYLFPVILGLFPTGAILAKELFTERNWIVVSYFSVTCLAGLYLLPHGLPVLPLNSYIKIYHLTANSDGRIPLPFENFYSRPIWNKILTDVSNEYHKLTPEEQKHCLIWGRHYSQAGIIDLCGIKYGLPNAISFHSSFYNWVTDFDRNTTFITISDSNLKEEYWRQYFEEVMPVASIENKYTSDYTWYTHNVFICRKLKFDSTALKQKFRNEVF